jgi:hypothetical protein
MPTGVDKLWRFGQDSDLIRGIKKFLNYLTELESDRDAIIKELNIIGVSI